jgi:hypothetical protein
VLMYTDTYGTPALLSDHFAPTTGGGEGREVDATDYYGFWKTFDGLRNCAFYGTDCAYGLGDTPEHRYMGHWAGGDNREVVPLQITDYVPAFPSPPVGGVAELPAANVDTSGSGNVLLPAALIVTTLALGMTTLGVWHYAVRRR